MRTWWIALAVTVLSIPAAYADEYFVSTQGDDSASGRKEEAAFATVGKGLKALKPGDTLTILPGEYFGANDVRIAGEEGKPITVRSKTPGAAVLRGDVDVTGFGRVPGLRYTWWAPMKRAVEGVAERDTSLMYAFVASVAEVEDVRRSCYHDPDAGKLYVHTSDSGPPESHRLIASLTNGFGIIFNIPRGERGPHDIVIDGLAFTGYMSREAAPRPGGLTRWGLYFVQPDRCIVRKCRAYLNGGGIGLVRPNDCLVEDCIAYGNFSTFCASGGNIISWSPAKNTIMRRNIIHTTNANGIRFYGGGSEDCVLEANLAYGCKMGGIWIKGGKNATSKIVRNVSIGAIYNSGGVDTANIHHNLCEFGSNIGDDASNVQLSKLRRFEPDVNFVDPAHHDYRLQSDSVLRGKGAAGADPGPFPYHDEVFFVGPAGSDRNKGTSAKQAWRTVQHALKQTAPGHTLYCLPGVDEEAVAQAKRTVDGVTIRHRGRPGRDHFAYAPPRQKVALRIEDVRVHSTTATTANMEWWTPTIEATTRLEWGPTPACRNTIEDIYDEGIFHTVSLMGLKPGTQYYYRVSAVSPVWEFHTNADLAAREKEKPRSVGRAETQSFRTLAEDAPAKTYHVAVTGDNSASGLTRELAWRTIRHAASIAKAGDTVLIHAGTYEEHVPVRGTGDKDRPVTFRSAPGEKVWMDGSKQKRNCAFRLAFKHHVHLDGLYFHNFRLGFYHKSGNAGAIHVARGSNNVVRRCFYDGRATTYMPFFILATDTSAFTLENSVVVQGWNGVSLWRCPDLTVRHCVFYNGLIRNVTLFNDAAQRVTFTHNLVCDNIPMKYRNALLSLWHLEAYRGDNNCYFSRYTAEERRLLDYVRVEGVKNPGHLLLADVRERIGQDKNTLFANPGMQAVATMQKQYETRAEHDRLELHRDAKETKPLDFVHFFANPQGPTARAADGKPIGLDPAAFANGRP